MESCKESLIQTAALNHANVQSTTKRLLTFSKRISNKGSQLDSTRLDSSETSQQSLIPRPEPNCKGKVTLIHSTHSHSPHFGGTVHVTYQGASATLSYCRMIHNQSIDASIIQSIELLYHLSLSPPALAVISNRLALDSSSLVVRVETDGFLAISLDFQWALNNISCDNSFFDLLV